MGCNGVGKFILFKLILGELYYGGGEIKLLKVVKIVLVD